MTKKRDTKQHIPIIIIIYFKIVYNKYIGNNFNNFMYTYKNTINKNIKANGNLMYYYVQLGQVDHKY